MKKNGKLNRALIMDRDGTLFRDSNYLDDPSKIRLYKGILPALKKLKDKGWKLIVGTNQSGVGRGYFTHSTVKKTHQHLQSIFKKQSLKIDRIYYCPHHPDVNCHCRKPKKGMLEAAQHDFNLDLKNCIIVGDKKCDIDWGRSTGAKSILVLTGYGRKASAETRQKADHIAKSLSHAVEWILKS